MKWLAMLLVIANAVLWYLSGPAPAPDPSLPQGQLPRVASLKPSVAIAGSRACLQVGWFKSRELAVSEGEQRGLPYRVESIERAVEPLNWVLIPSQPEKQALAQLAALRERGEEAWMVTEGPNRNAISLGLFESEQAASTVVEQKKRENLNVVLAKFPRNRIGYALVFEVEPTAKSPGLQAVEAEFGKKFEFVERVACKGVASPDKNP
ncbi:hypothetical protein SAMN05216429_111166 [Marinobacter persicus]|uniref:SPOR domain-containing protein n=1 Tax=Marinobacter persicus TaxID=930118 RepID=A0A1I3XFY0_9GAMM|nr:hypothetical protein [Marinobacter persicus]GHD54681.1 hypothetical protein GCM10008110_29230 [Marinobacter persicus]SFK17966.1 hypothetical protein SAMN05216429_111166 [Marinobacter persicus]